MKKNIVVEQLPLQYTLIIIRSGIYDNAAATANKPLNIAALPNHAKKSMLGFGMEKIMQAVEFETFVENGVIPIPVEYRNSVAESVKVIVLNKEPVKTAKKSKIYSIGVDMTGYKFNRDEANER
ncbi:MAG: hypothetical protein LBL44_07725 [Treponema sp.]|nr:hypothetical protein [Treponema sp.]